MAEFLTVPPLDSQETVQPGIGVAVGQEASVVAQQGMARTLEAMRPKASVMDTVSAATTMHALPHLLEWFHKPDFVDDPAFSGAALYDADPRSVLNVEWRDRIRGAKSREEYDWVWDRYKTEQLALRDIGDRPVLGGVVAALDPGMAAMDIATGMVGTAVLRTARVAQAARIAEASAAGRPALTVPQRAYSQDLLMTRIGAGVVGAGVNYGLAQVEDAVSPMSANAVAAQTVLGFLGGIMTTQGVLPHASPSLHPELERTYRNFTVPQLQTSGEKSALELSLHKELARYDRELADTWLDDPTNAAKNSIDSEHRSIRSELMQRQVEFEQGVLQEMTDRGAGKLHQLSGSRKAMQVQLEIESELAYELRRRELSGKFGIDLPDTASPSIRRIADAHDEATRAGLSEMQRAGVEGAEGIEWYSGYSTRQWRGDKVYETIDAFKRAGISDKVAWQHLTDLFQRGLKSIDKDMPDDVAHAVASALIDRSTRKVDLKDTALRTHIGNDSLADVRDLLEHVGTAPKATQKVMDYLAGKVDEKGKASFLKRRVEIDYSQSTTLPDGTRISIADMLDDHVYTNLDRYLDNVAGRSAMARMGVKSSSDIQAARNSLISKIPVADSAARTEAANLFDNMVAQKLGLPVGDPLSPTMQTISEFNRSVSLGMSGLWQVTELGVAAYKLGAGVLLKAMLKELPGFGDVLKPSKALAGELQHMLSSASETDIRLKPFTSRLADNFEAPVNAVLQNRLRQFGQLTSYVNGLKWVHGHMAKAIANIHTDMIVKATKGDAKALGYWAKYGVSADDFTAIASEIQKHGLNTTGWSREVWDKVRTGFQRAGDELVLHARSGELPSFVQFSQLGKFIWTFRNFMFAAHNKILANTLRNDGNAGVALLMLYQWPLMVVAAQAGEVMKGNAPLGTDELMKKSFSNMSVLGAFSMPFQIAFGDMNKFGAPGLIAVDRTIKVAQRAAHGDASGTAGELLKVTPVLAAVPIVGAVEKAFTD